MKVVVFGASGRTGTLLSQKVLDAGHEVTAFVRNPTKSSVQHAHLQVVQGNVLNTAQVAAVIQGADAVISVIGQTRPPTPELLTNGMKNIVAGMERANVTRIVYLTGAGVRHPNDKPGMADKIMGGLLKLIAGKVLEDSDCAARTLQASNRDWVIVRAPRLSEEPARGTYRTGYIQPGFSAISRADVADFMLKCVADDTYVREMPIISY